MQPVQEWPRMPPIIRGRAQFEDAALLLAELVEARASIAHDIDWRCRKVLLDLADLVNNSRRGVEHVQVKTVCWLRRRIRGCSRRCVLGSSVGFKRRRCRWTGCGSTRRRRAILFDLLALELAIRIHNPLVHEADREHPRREAAGKVDDGLVTLLLRAILLWQPTLPVDLQCRACDIELPAQCLHDSDLPLDPSLHVPRVEGLLRRCMKTEVKLHVQGPDLRLVCIVLGQHV
mmetsp:Transcript_115297/g.333066  ORF Transcript_115297/g.333066 Transcript_115297/m.333066 type:complete len:232 (-) Transcript_115297:1235-1930(-)